MAHISVKFNLFLYSTYQYNCRRRKDQLESKLYSHLIAHEAVLS